MDGRQANLVLGVVQSGMDEYLLQLNGPRCECRCGHHGFEGRRVAQVGSGWNPVRVQ